MKTEQGTTRYTPGPWRLEDDFIHADPEHGVGGQCCVVAQMYSGTDCAPAGQAAANARLVVVAPALLEAAKAVRALWAKHGLGDDDNESGQVWDALNDAIARSE